MHWRRKWQPTSVFLPGESQGWWSLVGCRLWGRTESDTKSNLAADLAAATALYQLLQVIPEMILSIWEDVCRLYANTAPFYTRDFSIHRLWYLWESWSQSFMDIEGQLHVLYAHI